MTLINFPAPSSLMLLPLAAILLFLRTGTEELFFHGNILQQLAARFQNPLIWFALPPIAFGLLHYELTVYGGIPLGGGDRDQPHRARLGRPHTDHRKYRGGMGLALYE